MAEDDHAFALRHHELRLARMRRDSEMQARTKREKEERELTFHPETHKNFHFKADPTKNTDNFMERVTKYEELRQLRLAQLHRKAWMEEEKSMERTDKINDRSSQILENSQRASSEISVPQMTGHKLREKEYIDHNVMDLSTGQRFFEPTLDKRSQEMVAQQPKDRYGTGTTNVGEALYRNAFNRQLRKLLAQKRIEDHEEHLRTRSKASNRTAKIMKVALARDIEVAFSATVGLREYSKTTDYDNCKNSNGTPLDSDEHHQVLIEPTELLQTLYILNFLPSFGNSSLSGTSRRNGKEVSRGGVDADHDFVANMWNVLSHDMVGHSWVKPTLHLHLDDLKQFLLNAIYPSQTVKSVVEGRAPPPPPLQQERAETSARHSPLEPRDHKSPFSDAPCVVHVDLGMTTDEDAGTMDADEANNEDADGETDWQDSARSHGCRTAPSFALVRTLLAEFRSLYKKVMPSGYRTIDSRERMERRHASKPQHPQSLQLKQQGRDGKMTVDDLDKTAPCSDKELGGRLHSLEAKEMKECTFQPSISKRSRQLAAANNKKLETFNPQSQSIRKREDLMLLKHQLTSGKIALMRQANEQNRLKDCTFQPDTSRSKRTFQQKCASNPVFAREDGPDLNTEARPDRTVEVGKRMHLAATEARAREKRRDKARLTTEEREMIAHCTFTPTKFSSTHRKATLAENKHLKSNASVGRAKGWVVPSRHDVGQRHTPLGYEQSITRMRQAHARKLEKERIMATHGTLRSGHRISPVKDLHAGTHRDAHGKIVSKPFIFHSSRKNRLEPKKAVTSTDNATMTPPSLFLGFAT
jgi:hypothetical protein